MTANSLPGFVLALDPITPGQQRVLDALATGQSNKEIAASLFIAPGTVRAHVGELMSKLNAKSRLQVVVTAQKWGLVDFPGELSIEGAAILVLLESNPQALDELVAAGALNR